MSRHNARVAGGRAMLVQPLSQDRRPHKIHVQHLPPERRQVWFARPQPRWYQALGQSGYSLLELIVVMVIVGIVSLSLGNFMIRGLNGYNFVQTQSDTALELQTLMTRVTKVVRGATSLDTTGANSLIMYGYFSPQDTVIKKIRYYVSGTNLNIGVTPPSGTAPNYTYFPGDEKITTTRIDLVMGSNNLFTYYDDAGNLLTGSFLPGQVKAVGMYVAANPLPKQIKTPISLSSRVTLRNLKTNL